MYDIKYLIYSLILSGFFMAIGTIGIFAKPRETTRGPLRRLSLRGKLILYRITGWIFFIFGVINIIWQVI